MLPAGSTCVFPRYETPTHRALLDSRVDPAHVAVLHRKKGLDGHQMFADFVFSCKFHRLYGALAIYGIFVLFAIVLEIAAYDFCGSFF